MSHGLVSSEQLDEALERQRENGGLLGENLLALGHLTKEGLASVMFNIPEAPDSIEGTGLSESFLLNLSIKLMYMLGLETSSQLAASLGLPRNISMDLIDVMRERRLAEVLGKTGDGPFAELRLQLTEKGKSWAIEAMQQSQYVGAAPVPLTTYNAQVERQGVRTERIVKEVLEECFAHLVMPDGMLERFGPAVNSGRAMLIYGPAGNGKTTVAEAIGRAFSGIVFVPHAIEADGQVIKVYDPTLHKRVEQGNGEQPSLRAKPVRSEDRNYDQRWVPCHRPTVIAGGEMTMAMLDLGFNPHAKIYEAPLQIKAMNGVFIIDDFGRQTVDPADILNRWIVPLQNKVDYLALNTGRKFRVPFDTLLIFSTNLSPRDLMDEAFLRRIPYKIEMARPDEAIYREIFHRVCAASGMEITEEIFQFLFTEFYPSSGLALSANHPKFLIDCIIDHCRFNGVAPRLDRRRLEYALINLMVN